MCSELLPVGQIVKTEVYCRQLVNLKAAVATEHSQLAKRCGVFFPHDNEKPHTSLGSRQKLAAFDWDVIPHPPYSPDLAPSDYHLFRSLQHSLDGQSFQSLEDVKNHLHQYFESKDRIFWEEGIFNLPDGWSKVVAQSGQYLI